MKGCSTAMHASSRNRKASSASAVPGSAARRSSCSFLQHRSDSRFDSQVNATARMSPLHKRQSQSLIPFFQCKQ